MALQRGCGLIRQFAIKGRSDALVGADVHVGCAVVVVAMVAAEEARAECLSVHGACLERGMCHCLMLRQRVLRLNEVHG